MNKIKCSICEEFDESGDEFFTIAGKPACTGCWEDARESASTLVKFNPDGEIEEFYFDQDFGDFEGGDLPEPIKAVKWVNTDGWRGYTNYEIVPGFEEIADGWVTGWPDETTKEKAELGDYYEQLKSGDLIPPVALYWVFGRTSNLFSTASSIYVRTDDKDKLAAWLEEVNGGLDEFSKKFN